MRITLELTEQQANVFQQLLETTLQSLTYQETVLRDSIEDMHNKNLEGGTLEPQKLQEQRYVQDFLAMVIPQRILVAEILHTVMESEKKTSIITNDLTMPNGQRLEHLFDN